MWTFIWLMVILKIPIVALFLIVRWAVRQTPETAARATDGGIGPLPRPRTLTTRARDRRGRPGGARTAIRHRRAGASARAPRPSGVPRHGLRRRRPAPDQRRSSSHDEQPHTVDRRRR